MDSDSKRNKFSFNGIIVFIAVIVVLALVAACCLFKHDPPPPPPPKPAKIETARDILFSVARGSVLYSGQRGGNGKTKFPTKPSDLVDNIPPVVARALVGCTDQTVPCDGYLCRMVEVKSINDFLFEAYPAEGFSGDSFIITRDLLSAGRISKKGELQEPTHKTQSSSDSSQSVSPQESKSNSPVKQQGDGEKVSPKTTVPATSVPKEKQGKTGNASSDLWGTTKTKVERGVMKIKETFNPPPPPPPPIRPAKPETAKEMLQSVCRASKLYSAQNGGNGKFNFPTKATQIIDLLPQVIKNSIVFLRDEEQKAVPIDGYILVMYPSKTQNPTDDFCFVAYPAKYFSGPHFEITKNGVITQISKE